MSGGSSRRYPPELRERAVRMVAEIRGQHDSEWAAISEVARLLGVGTAETVRKWVRQAEIDGGSRPGVSTDESAELKRLKRENAELKRAIVIWSPPGGVLDVRHGVSRSLVLRAGHGYLQSSRRQSLRRDDASCTSHLTGLVA